MRKHTFKKLLKWENNNKTNIKENQQEKFMQELNSFKDAILKQDDKKNYLNCCGPTI